MERKKVNVVACE